MSSAIHKIKDTLTGHHNEPHHEGAHGPHNSRAANAADPRIDSDMDYSHNAGMAHNNHHEFSHGDNYTTGGPGMTGAHTAPRSNFTGGATTHHPQQPTTAGPHNSNMANKLDPRVDSDMDGSRNMGMNRTTHPNGAPQHNTGFGGPTNAGPHDSNMANKMDPRFDSDLDGRGARHHNQGGMMGAGGPPHHERHEGPAGGMTGGSANHPGSSNYGPHSSNLMNKMDPRVDSDYDGRAANRGYGGEMNRRM